MTWPNIQNPVFFFWLINQNPVSDQHYNKFPTYLFTSDQYKESFTSNSKTQLMERDPISPFGASHVLHFVLATRYCKVPLYSLSTGIYL